MSTTPTVTFVVPLHNKREFLGETLESLANQTFRDWEAVVVDNNSTDSGAQVALAFGDHRVRVISSAPVGVSATRNAGIRDAKGEWVCFLDADDLVDPDYLESQLSAAGEDSSDVVVCHYREFQDNEMADAKWVASFEKARPLESIRAASIVYCPGPQHIFMVKRRLLGEGISWSSDLDALLGEDCAFWFEVLHRGSVAFNKEAPALYRIGVEAGRFASLSSPEKLYRGLSKAIECNEATLARLSMEASGAQAEHIMDFYSRVGLSLETEGNAELAQVAFENAEAWLHRIPLKRALTSPNVGLRNVIGCRAFSRFRARCQNS